MRTKTMNVVYVKPNDPSSGIFRITDGPTAQNFRDRFLTEVGKSQGNGYDSYMNGNGPARSDVLPTFSAQGLAKLIVLSLDALHMKAASTDTAEATEAMTVLSAIRDFDKVAGESAANRHQENVAAMAMKMGLTPEKLAEIINRQSNPQPQAVQPATVAPEQAADAPAPEVPPADTVAGTDAPETATEPKAKGKGKGKRHETAATE